MSLPVIFLDLDGPLFPSRSMFFPENKHNLNLFPPNLPETIRVMCGYWKMDPLAVLMLNKVIEITNTEFVISSSWREVCDKHDMEILFELNGLDVTFHQDWETPRTNFHTIRSHEIKSWLEDHPEVTKWVAVDDDESIKTLPKKNRVLVSYDDGILMQHYRHMIEVLS